MWSSGLGQSTPGHSAGSQQLLQLLQLRPLLPRGPSHPHPARQQQQATPPSQQQHMKMLRSQRQALSVQTWALLLSSWAS
jgi:hypothetical protein